MNSTREWPSFKDFDRLSCQAFYANYFRLLLHTCAYNFTLLLRGNLNNTALADAKIDTFRLKVLKVGAWIKTTVRRIWIHFSSAWPFRDLFWEIHMAIVNSPHYSLA
ncbi:transposase [Candidatus Saganbacteria bacterium]|nr:transposase [Candidatus Saganbacteria bacterium]